MAATSQHGEVSGRADSHMMAAAAGLLIAFLDCDSAFTQRVGVHELNRSGIRCLK